MQYDRIIEPLKKIIRALTSRVDYCAFYSAKVISQNADGTVDIQPSATKWAGLQSVPIWSGTPGAVATVQPGALVLFSFVDANPAFPIAFLWQQGSVNTSAYSTISFAGGQSPVVRVADSVGCGTLTVAGTGVTLTYTPPSGPVQGPSTTVSLSGSISGGNPNVRA